MSAANEIERLSAIRRYEILDTPADGAFDRLTQLAARLFEVPVAIVSLVDHDRIWFKSHYGLGVEQIEREPGLCASAILQDEVYTVLDAKIDPRTLVNPLVAGEFGLRFYAAAPLVTQDGFRLGTMCIIDFAPRSLDTAGQQTLRDLAAIVMDEMELRLASRKIIDAERALRLEADRAMAEAERLSNLDKLTGLSNRRALDKDMDCHALILDAAHMTDVVIAMIDLNGLKVINDGYGHTQGDWVLSSFAKNLRGILRQEDRAYRYGGDEFVLFLPVRIDPDYGSLRRRIQQVVERVRQDVGFSEVGAAVGFSSLTECGGEITRALYLADKRMYAEKHKRKLPVAQEFPREGCASSGRGFIERRA
ncbi:MAG TPA: sensor domain-containing diguanylate cyclase [Burkholderiales bacterium]|nr:sensor domain-containing diguanylate cyclase [Burkholderiales bacterium]